MGVAPTGQQQQMTIWSGGGLHRSGGARGGRSVDAELAVGIATGQRGQAREIAAAINRGDAATAIHQRNQPAQLLGDLLGRRAAVLQAGGAGLGLGHGSYAQNPGAGAFRALDQMPKL